MFAPGGVQKVWSPLPPLASTATCLRPRRSLSQADGQGLVKIVPRDVGDKPWERLAVEHHLVSQTIVQQCICQAQVAVQLHTCHTSVGKGDGRMRQKWGSTSGRRRSLYSSTPATTDVGRGRASEGGSAAVRLPGAVRKEDGRLSWSGSQGTIHVGTRLYLSYRG